MNGNVQPYCCLCGKSWRVEHTGVRRLGYGSLAGFETVEIRRDYATSLSGTSETEMAEAEEVLGDIVHGGIERVSGVPQQVVDADRHRLIFRPLEEHRAAAIDPCTVELRLTECLRSRRAGQANGRNTAAVVKFSNRSNPPDSFGQDFDYCTEYSRSGI